MRVIYFLFGILGITLISKAVAQEICKANCSHHHSAQLCYDFASFDNSRALTGDYDVKYHRLEWQVDPAVLYISGTVTTYFSSKIDNLTDVFFDLSDSLTVTDVLYHGSSVSFSQPGDHLLEINLPTPINTNDLDSVSIIYDGKPYSGGLGSFGVGAHGAALTPVLWTLSEPYGSRDWWPCKHNLTDKIDSVDIIVTCPDEYRAASNGVLIREEVSGGLREMHWRHRYKIPAYLVAIAVTDYVDLKDMVYLESGDSIPIHNLVYAERVEGWVNRENDLENYLKYFSELFGIYPFYKEKYGHANFPWGGGMEHQTMSFMGGSSKQLIAHELAHQWFGNKVTCGSWEDIWLNESFATFLTELTIEKFESEEDWMNYKVNTLESIISLGDGSVFVDDTTNVGRIFNFRLTYQKGSMVLRMLRWKLGDEIFFQALYNYMNHPDLIYGYAKTPDLITELQIESGLNLSEYFNDWFYGEGYPAYTIDAFQDGGNLRLRAYQGTSHPSVDFYEMPIPVKCYGDGKDTLYRLEHTFSGQEWNVQIPFKIDSLKFDPDIYLISGNNEVNFNFKQNFIDVFPNPTTDFIQVNSSNHVKEVLIYSVDGSLVYQKDFNEVAPIISLESLSSGTYLVKVISDLDEEVFTVVKTPKL